MMAAVFGIIEDGDGRVWQLRILTRSLAKVKNS